jgi:transcriptional regulator with XRE-family HTH domain
VPGVDDDVARDVTDQRFARNLREARERLGISQSAVAATMRALGHPMPQQTIARIEAGQRRDRRAVDRRGARPGDRAA